MNRRKLLKSLGMITDVIAVWKTLVTEANES
jgi:hypothetical protein